MKTQVSTSRCESILFFGLIFLCFVGCKEDEPVIPTEPEVRTITVTEIATTSATVLGEVIKDGNTTVTATGFVYSSAISEPTLSDEKIALSDTEGEFTTLLQGLNSGTTYHIRAYATNSAGTGYGEVLDFTTANVAPIVTNVTITGNLEVNKELAASYTYNDGEGDLEGSTTFQWYVADDNVGTGQTAIVGATEKKYTIKEAQQGKYISVGIAPKALTGNTSGTEVRSAFFGSVGAATTITFMYNGQEVTYGIISRPTGKKWLDRNLGAQNAPSSASDFQNYGDLFQWGRLADGHQLMVRTGATDAGMAPVKGTTTIAMPYAYSTTDVPGHSLWIYISTSEDNSTFGDWRATRNNNLWQGVNGTNNPCPSGWRIPTQAEWAAEGITDLTDGFNKLKLTYTGVRTFKNELLQSASNGNYWTSTVGTTNPGWVVRARVYTSFALVEQPRGQGYACRCIKD